MHHYRPQPSWDKVIFSQACDSVHGGGGGHAWLLGACVVGGGACVVVGACVHGCRGGMHGGGGACGGACMEYDEIRSMSGRYASYWNAFLLNDKASL